MRLFYTFIFIFILLNSLESKEVPIEKARKSAQIYFYERWKSNKLPFNIINEEVIYSNSKPTLYIFNLVENKGFIIISAEDSMPELLGYSLEGSYNESSIPDAFKDLLNQYSDEIQNKRNNNCYKNEDLFQNNYKSTNFITPLITTKWDQSCFYNDSCPTAPTAGAYYCQHVPAGCVAICLSQIIKHHQFPLVGNGFNSYYTPYYGTLHANFGNTNYNYNLMTDVLFSSNQSVAQLIYHCGVAVNMDYKPQYSGAGIVEARNALVNYFNYASSTQIVQRSAYSDGSWKALIKSELDSARPVFYSGYNQNNNGGHAFICDGYQAKDFFHINWGWGGQYDGYFLLSVLNPNSNNFSYNQSAIVGIKPQNNFPIAHFTANQTLINSGGAINFTDISTGNPTNWSWNFTGGNPSSSNLKNPQNIIYSTPGIYPVSLTVGNAMGNNNLIKSSYIIVAPIADFYASKTVISTAETINFTDNSTVISPPTSRFWVFTGGNPSTSNQANPSNISYSQPGTYKVSLTINTAEGNHTINKSNYITVYANCTYQFKDSIPNYYINPANASAFQINQEDFDSLLPYYSGLGHSTKWNVFNKINSPGDTNFFYGATSFFTQTGQANNWLEFGPLTIPQNGAVIKWEHLYYLNTKRDGYEVLLSTSGITRDYYTAPPIFSRADNDPLTNNDTMWTSQEVNIDGSIYGGQQIYIAFHHFANNKYYIFLDNIKLVFCSGLPVHADFTADSTNINLGASVDFSDISTGNPISWKWTFYDGNPLTSTLQNPIGITYNTQGYHSVKLVVNNGEQSDSITKTNFIFSDNTGIFANEIFNNIQIYPNPVTDYLTVKIPANNKTILNIKIYNMIGNEIKELNFSESENSVLISMSEFPIGIYIIEVKTNRDSIYKKIIKTE